tara:strand:+ start:167 stop:448 length:282 start_codon:yes stop_codon:yes gene_type:complete
MKTPKQTKKKSSKKPHGGPDLAGVEVLLSCSAKVNVMAGTVAIDYRWQDKEPATETIYEKCIHDYTDEEVRVRVARAVGISIRDMARISVVRL